MPVYWIWFAELKGVSLLVKQQLLLKFRDPEELFMAGKRGLQDLEPAVQEALQEKALTGAWEIYNRCSQRGIHILTWADADYPQRLRNIEDPPMVLYCKGQLPNWQNRPVIGVVGTRKASPYGLQTAHLLASQIAVCGGLVVSGLATGIDALSMEGALDAGEPVVGVLGCGVDVVYPARNKALYRRTEENGCLISEYPPGCRPYPGNFLRRNRIISGISDGLLVVEAPAESGALNTARHAFSQGRDLFAAPGNLGVETSLGSNSLLQEGAYPALCGWDVIKHYENLYPGTVKNLQNTLPKMTENTLSKVAQTPAVPAKEKQKFIDNRDKSTYSVINERPANLNDQENAVLALLTAAPQLPDSIMDASELPSGTVQSVLTRLAIKGLAVYHPDGRVSRK